MHYLKRRGNTKQGIQQSIQHLRRKKQSNGCFLLVHSDSDIEDMRIVWIFVETDSISDHSFFSFLFMSFMMEKDCCAFMFVSRCLRGIFIAELMLFAENNPTCWLCLSYMVPHNGLVCLLTSHAFVLLSLFPGNILLASFHLMFEHKK